MCRGTALDASGATGTARPIIICIPFIVHAGSQFIESSIISWRSVDALMRANISAIPGAREFVRVSYQAALSRKRAMGTDGNP